MQQSFWRSFCTKRAAHSMQRTALPSDESLKRYLSASRRISSRIPAFDRYNKLYSSVLKYMRNGPEPSPELVTIYSQQRKSEIVSFNGKEFLLFDQYLAQTFSQLNRIFFHAKDAMPAIGYGCKVVAEQLLLSGRPRLAVLFGLSYQKISVDHKLPSGVNDLESTATRAILTTLQEFYIMAHEMGHFLVRYDRLRSSGIPEMVHEHLNDQITSKQEWDSAELLHKYRERYGEPPEDMSETLKATVEFKRLLLERYGPALEVELVCDIYANFVVFHVAEEMNLDQRHTSESLFLAFKYLRLLQHMKYSAIQASHLLASTPLPMLHHDWLGSIGDRISDKRELSFLTALLQRPWEASLMVDISISQIREQVNRDSLRMLRMSLTEEQDASETHISDCADRFDEIIEYPITIDLRERVAKLPQSDFVESEVTWSGTEQNAIKIADKLVGWRQSKPVLQRRLGFGK